MPMGFEGVEEGEAMRDERSSTADAEANFDQRGVGGGNAGGVGGGRGGLEEVLRGLRGGGGVLLRALRGGGGRKKGVKRGWRGLFGIGGGEEDEGDDEADAVGGEGAVRGEAEEGVEGLDEGEQARGSSPSLSASTTAKGGETNGAIDEASESAGDDVEILEDLDPVNIEVLTTQAAVGAEGAQQAAAASSRQTAVSEALGVAEDEMYPKRAKRGKAKRSFAHGPEKEEVGGAKGTRRATKLDKMTVVPAPPTITGLAPGVLADIAAGLGGGGMKMEVKEEKEEKEGGGYVLARGGKKSPYADAMHGCVHPSPFALFWLFTLFCF